jgi:hypothetical protein
MPPDEPPDKDPKTGDVIKTLFELLLKDEEFKKSLGRRTVYFILATLAIATAELTVGIPIITLASAPFVGAIIVFLFAQVEDWIRSGKPKIIFYLCPNIECPNPVRFRPIKWVELSKYRKRENCSDCGRKFITRCPKKHYIVSPDFEKPDVSPTLDSFCPRCGLPYFPKSKP